MEKILRIEKDVTFKIGESCWGGYDGFEVVTDDQTIRVGITNEQSCCENWGYFMTNDDPSEFIGANLISVDIVDTCLVKDKAPALYEGDAMFVNFETSAGTLQFVAYNAHNGYYGHEAVVVSKQLEHSVSL